MKFVSVRTVQMANMDFSANYPGSDRPPNDIILFKRSIPFDRDCQPLSFQVQTEYKDYLSQNSRKYENAIPQKRIQSIDRTLQTVPAINFSSM
jgi:hypothetical protein